MDQNTLWILLIVLGYLSGSIPFGYIIAKFKNIDIRKKDSGNIGGTNVYRSMGLGYAVLVAALDVSKVLLPSLLARYYLANEWMVSLVVLVSVLGHIFPVWIGFKGGKAVSGVFASMIAVIGWQYSLVFLLLWAVLLRMIKIMSLTNLIIVWIIPLLFYFFTHSIPFTVLGLAYVPILYWSHRENIKRLREGTEKRIIKS